jgi:hypothetical protein
MDMEPDSANSGYRPKFGFCQLSVEPAVYEKDWIS